MKWTWPAGALALTLVALPMPALAVEEPPALPAAGGGCAGASPVVVAAAPGPQSRMAPGPVSALTTGHGVVVAVIDTGVSRRAAALAGAVQPGRDMVGGGPADTDCPGRGTALAGIVAARPVPGTAMVGMAPEATILPVRVVDSAGRLPARALADGIRFAADRRASVILVGAGVTEDSLELRDAVLRAAAADSLIVVAATAGADGAVTYPAAYPHVLSVTDTGTRADGTLSAPVAGAYSIGPSGNGHYRVDGPAVAAAYVAGAAALLRSYRPRLYWTQIRDRLLATAQPAPAGTAGAGVLDPYAAIADLVARRPVPSPEAATVRIPGPAPDDPAVRAAGLAGTALLATAAALAALTAGIRALRRRRG